MRPAVERLRPQIRKTCREKPMQPHPQSRKTCRPSEKHTFAIPQRSASPRGSRSNGCVHKSGKHVAKIPCNRNRNLRIHKAEKHVALQKNIHSPSPKGARRPRASRPNGCVHKSGKHVAKIPCNRIHKAEKHVALQKSTHSPSPQRSAPLHAARGRTVASTNQENMSRKTNATETALTIVPVCC